MDKDNKLQSTLINSQIAKFYQQNTNIVYDDVKDYFNADKTFNLTKILILLLHDPGQNTYEKYLSSYEKLLPIFIWSHQEFRKDISIEKLNLSMLGSNFYAFIKSWTDIETIEESTKTVEYLLLLTSVLERGLGNVFYSYTKGRTPPHLLKDLLETDELFEVFEVEAIVFLKILLGSPKSINLRNIVWHGFPKPSDIPAYYVTALLLTVHTLGKILSRKMYDLQFRPQIIELTLSEINIEHEFLDILLKNQDDDEQQQILSTCNWLSDGHKVFWTKLFSYYKTQMYWNFVILILPQIELLLRLIYGRANDYDVSAKLYEYYITIDTIFESDVPVNGEACQRKNRLLSSESQVSEGALKYMYDLFIAANGPRLRDKVSHGEVCLDAINNAEVCRILLYLGLNLLTGNEEKFPLVNYESKFHLNCLTKQAFVSANMKLLTLVELHVDDNFELKNVDTDVELKSTSIFQRPKKEPQLMLLIFKNIEMCAQTCSNYDESIRTSLALLEKYELYSKRRRTLDKLLASLPQICGCLNNILERMNMIFKTLQNSNETTFSEAIDFDKFLRFLKHTLKISENFVKYSHKDRNEWIKALELCCKFHKVRADFN